MKTIIVQFRREKVEIPLLEDLPLTVGDVKEKIAQVSTTIKEDDTNHDSLEAYEVQLIFAGKKLSQDSDDLRLLLGSKTKKRILMVARGISRSQTQKMEQDFQDGTQKFSRFVRDDISDQGKQKLKERQILGRQMMQKAKVPVSSSTSQYGFGRIETLPNLPDETKARAILKELANDPGVIACMSKHKWNVGSLAELYPKGKVGESAVCVMGLNRNKGQQILLRLRTDDLKGFRKMASIREVLYHELAHNVHSEHNQDFFQLMRTIKKECLEMDWTQGMGLSEDGGHNTAIVGGTYVLGGDPTAQAGLSAAALAGRAAILRLTAEEEEVRQSCGCGHEETLFQNKDENRERSDGSDR